MLERIATSDGLVVLVSPLLRSCGVPHAFTTRHGGRIGELDLTVLDGRRMDAVRQALGCPAHRVVGAHQVHGAQVHECDAAEATAAGGARRTPASSEPVRADALVTSQPDELLAIRTADCVPVLIADVRGAHVAAVHAGWKGVLAGVVPAAIAALRRRGAPTYAAIGPSIGAEAFEVGDDVAERFVRAGLEDVVSTRDGRPHVDLRGAVRRQLVAARLTDERIDDTDACTYRDAETFFSHRRDVTHGASARTGRLVAAIAPATDA